MPYKRKYKQGEQIKTLQQFTEQDLVFWRGKVYNAAFLWSWQFRMIVAELNAGRFYTAVRTENEKG